jgi:hypothetical protein
VIDMATTVKFGNADATNVTVNSENEVVATTPAGTAGAVDVTVTTSGGSDILTDGFEYTA